MSVRLIVAPVVLALLAAAGPHAQLPSSADAQRPTFRATIAVVQFEATVLDKEGRPIENLTADDFEVRQDGVRVPVQLVTFIGGRARVGITPGVPAIAKETGNAALLAGAEAAGGIEGTRDIVVVMDERNMTFDSHRRGKEALRSLVDDMLGPSDRVLLVSTAPDRELVLSFESNRDVLREQIDALTWDATFREPVKRDASDRECTSMGLTSALTADVMSVGSFGVLSQLLSELRAFPGRKTMFWMTDGLVQPRCIDAEWALTERIRRLTDLASRSGVVVYGVQTSQWSSQVMMPAERAPGWAVRGPVLPVDPRTMHIRDEHLRHVADRTGGLVTRSNDIDVSLREALDDSRSYYLLAYTPPDGTFSDRFEYRTLDVRVKRRGAQVRTRSGFYSVPDESLATR